MPQSLQSCVQGIVSKSFFSDRGAGLLADLPYNCFF